MKETRKQIVEQTRNEVAKQFSHRIKELELVNARLLNDNENLSKENRSLKTSNLELNDKNEQLRDWIERLQEFMSLPEDARQQYIDKIKAEQELNRFLTPYMNLYKCMFSI